MSDKIFIETEEAMKYLSMGRNAVLDLCRTKKENFPAVKAGRKYRINYELLREWAKDVTQRGVDLSPENDY